MAIAWEFTLDPIVGLVNKLLSDGCNTNWFYQLITGSWLGFNPAENWYGNACADRMPNWLGNKKYAYFLFPSQFGILSAQAFPYQFSAGLKPNHEPVIS